MHPVRSFAVALLVAGLSGCCASPYRYFQNSYGFCDPHPDYYAAPGPRPPRQTPPGPVMPAVVPLAKLVNASGAAGSFDSPVSSESPYSTRPNSSRKVPTPRDADSPDAEK